MKFHFERNHWAANLKIWAASFSFWAFFVLDMKTTFIIFLFFGITVGAQIPFVFGI